jgi:hypothetical protein
VATRYLIGIQSSTRVSGFYRETVKRRTECVLHCCRRAACYSDCVLLPKQMLFLLHEKSVFFTLINYI